jgi:hypothetical protein
MQLLQHIARAAIGQSGMTQGFSSAFAAGFAAQAAVNPQSAAGGVTLSMNVCLLERRER